MDSIFNMSEDAVLACAGSDIIAVEVVGVSRSSKAAGFLRVLRQGGVVHADDNAASAAQMQDCLQV